MRINVAIAVSLLTTLIPVLAHSYAHDGLYKIYAKPYADRCESRANKANVSRTNEQLLINNCLHDYIIKAARKIVSEVPEYASSSGRDSARSLSDAREDVAEALRMYDDGVFTHPSTEETSRGAKAQKGLEIELGRKIDQLKIMENQPSLMNVDD